MSYNIAPALSALLKADLASRHLAVTSPERGRVSTVTGSAAHRTTVAALAAPFIADLQAEAAADALIAIMAAARAIGFRSGGVWDGARAAALAEGGLKGLLRDCKCSASDLAFATRGGEAFRALASLGGSPQGTPARTVLSTLAGCPAIRAALRPVDVAPVKAEEAAPAAVAITTPPAVQAEEAEPICEVLPTAAVQAKGKAKGKKGGKG